MAADIFGERFYGYREPAWHGIGLVSQESTSAVQALESLGDYNVTLHELTLAGLDETIPQKAIVRWPTKDDPVNRVFGIVSDTNYLLLQPRELCEVWDRSIEAPVETIGCLGHGETVFITAKLPTVDVKGDEVRNFIIADHGMTGKSAMHIRITPVRVVCQNTLVMARESATESYRLVHSPEMKHNLEKWLQYIWSMADEKVRTLHQFLGLLAETKVKKPTAVKYVNAVYADPTPPNTNGPAEIVSRREDDYERWLQTILDRRQAAMALFNGYATGADAPAFKGTAYGLYNSVAELENYRRGADKSAMVSTLWGHRAAVMEWAFVLAMRVANDEPLM